ncbi:villin-like protein quail isoform X1 [Apis mellifera]|uniref:Villin-like protein quail isoform X1 n=2 Tax=Apis mellifera TaxID=7460 RepID=A0A7M7R7Z6_APIME|nr:villin-like protein quail isoform X1 [Apis mellifera]|eukprot:XP_393805.3 villin-like protein quail isoform X1 [Apis mellifera]
MSELSGKIEEPDDRSYRSDDSNGEIFKNVPKNSSTFRIWKIEGLRITAVTGNNMGYFLSELAYIIYAVSPKDGPLPYPGMPSKELKSTAIIRVIHFWIGSACDSTISGAAALRAAELDSQVSATILSREAQGRESPRFLAYFRQYLIIENFHFETPSCRLHRVTGITIPILTELEKVHWDYFSSRDVIIVDVLSQNIVFLWLGSSSDPLHKRHAVNILEMRKKNNNGRIIIVDDGYEQTLLEEDRQLFASILDPSTRVVKPDRLYRINMPSPVKLYRCSEQSGKYKVAELKSGPILRSDLTSEAVYLIDRGEAGVWAWVGSNVNAREKLETIRNARGFGKKKNYSNGILVGRALETYEPTEMKVLVRGWSSTKIRPLTLPPNFDPDYMNERPKMATACQLVDDGSGERTLWRVTHKEGMIQIDDKGIYYAEACYVMCYKYGQGRRSRTIIYCWEGVHSINADREAVLEVACRLAEDTGGQLVKAYQGREPPHLLQIYDGKLKILAGRHRDFPPEKYLVRVFGSTSYTSKAVERPLRSSSLDSSGVFILFSNSPVVWCGGKSTGDARQASRRLAPRNAPLITENNENNDFWAELGGKGTYGTEVINDEEELEKHLYQCLTDTETFVGEEVLGFGQCSLLPEAVWLLDAGNVIWIWIGKSSISKSLKEYVHDAKVFLFTHPAGRDRNTIISIIKQGLEPSTFIGLFNNWNYNLLREYKSFEIFCTLLQDKKLLPKIQTLTKSSSDFDNYVKYPLSILKDDPENLPSDVDVAHKEMHLTFDNFIAIFKMEPNEFIKLPTWKRQRLKQSAGLF